MRLYLKFLSMHVKSQMQYKVSFFLTLLGEFSASFAALLGVWFMFLRFHEVEGFTFQQILVCLGTILMSSSLAECFGRSFDRFPQMISNGQFDRILVRPRNESLLVLWSEVDFSRFGRLIQAVIVLSYALFTCGIGWTWLKVVTLLLMIGGGTVVFFCLLLVYAGISFFTIEGLEFMNILTHGGREFGRYPYAIYGDRVLKFLTFVVPLALVQYYPLLYLLDLETSFMYMLSPLGGVLFAPPAYGFWRFGLRRYTSTGS
jgi:ABC-2 type transport system permease protein